MSMEVFLMAALPDLGSEGDVVTVADGYARNYLLPKKLAAPVTDATRRQLAKIQRDREAAVLAAKEDARTRADKIDNTSCTIAVKTDDGKLYGSVTTSDIEASLKSQGLDIERSMLQLEEPIKELGVYPIVVKLHPEVAATIKVWVVEE